MNVLVLLNGYNLRRHPADLPERLGAAARRAGHGCRVEISESLDHMLALFGSGAESGTEAILVGGGDGTLHHAVNHPLAGKVVVGVLPLGTINAFLRSARVPHADPMLAMERLLGGGPRTGRCGLVGGRRFACFASWGYDARVVHRNSPALKRRIGAASYLAAGVGELVRWRDGQVRGGLRVDGDRKTHRATSAIVSKIDNYAGVRAFGVGVEEPAFDAIVSPSDDPLSALGFWTNVAALRKPLLRGTRRFGGVRRIRWVAPKATFVQADGEAIELADARRFAVAIDPTPQRYWLPD